MTIMTANSTNMGNRSETPGAAVVTGAGSGMGRATAIAFARAGASKVALLDKNLAGIEETKKLILSNLSSQSIQVDVHQCDVASPEQVASTYATIRAAFGRIDYSIHCAGIGDLADGTRDISVDTFDRYNNINYRGLWLCSREALKTMLSQSLDCEAYPSAGIDPNRAQRGAIVNFASFLGSTVIPKFEAYCATKAAVLSLTRSHGVDYAPDRIRVNAVAPGIMDTPMTNATPETTTYVEDIAMKRAPMQRRGQPEEVADVVVFLCSNKASYMTGSEVRVDGGCTTNFF